MEMSVANQKDISGSRRPNFAHRQVLFANGTNVNYSPLDNEIQNLTELVST